MSFEQTYRRMNESIAPSDALIVDTLARARAGRRPKRRLRRAVAVAVAAAVALSSTAAALQATGRFSALYAAVARWLRPVGQSCTQDGITLQVESAYLQGHLACIVFTLRDTQDSRLDAADLCLDGIAVDGWTMGSASWRLLDWDAATQTATFFAEFDVLNRTLDAAQPLTFSVDAVTPVLSIYDGEALPVDLPGAPNTAAVQPHAVDPYLLSDGSEAPQNYDFLTLQTSLWQSADGLFALYAARPDGQLHLQLRVAQAAGASGLLELVDADGQAVPTSASYSYTDGGLHCREAVYDVPADRLADYTPVLYGAVDGAAVEGEWQVTFRLEEK